MTRLLPPFRTHDGIWRIVAAALLGSYASLGCSSLGDQLRRGRGYYEDNQYERALALWRSLGERENELSRLEQTRYAYLRGMTDFRLGFREEARHWLSLALAYERLFPGGLEPVWRSRLGDALAELNGGVFGLERDGGDAVQLIESPRSPAPVSRP